MKSVKAVLVIAYFLVGFCTPLVPLTMQFPDWHSLLKPVAVLAAIIGGANAVIAFYDPTHRPVRRIDSKENRKEADAKLE